MRWQSCPVWLGCVIPEVNLNRLGGFAFRPALNPLIWNSGVFAIHHGPCHKFGSACRRIYSPVCAGKGREFSNAVSDLNRTHMTRPISTPL